MALLVLSTVVAIIDITTSIKEDSPGKKFSMTAPQFGPGVGLVRVSGPIDMEGSSSPFAPPSGAMAVVDQLDRLSKNSDIRAVVVRINSPGGTVGASQEIYQKIWKLRKKNIPVIASMGDIATSGGYYIASACDFIMANHGTITGSIGVIALSPNMTGLFDKLGISMNVIKSGPYKDSLASYRNLSAGERRLLQEMINTSYEKFVEDVSLGRNMPQRAIRPYADGRVFTGMAAKKYKLIDEIGTFEDAVNKARELAGLSENAPFYKGGDNPLEDFFMGLQGVMKGFSGEKFLREAAGYGDAYRLEYRYRP